MASVSKPILAFLDDDVLILRKLKAIFHSSYKVFITTDPAEYVDYVKDNQVHVAVSDQRMPERLGVDILREVKEISPATVRILLTGYEDLEVVIEAINEGEIFRYLTKPYEITTLQDTIEQAIKLAALNFLQAHKSNTNIVPAPLEPAYLDTMVSILHGIQDVSLSNPAILQENKLQENGALTAEPAFATKNAPAAVTLQEENESSLPSDYLLLVDSDPVIQQKVQQQFSHKYVVLCANNIEQACHYLSHHNVGVCITDVMLNNESLAPSIATLKQKYPGLVVLVQTQFQEASLLIELINQGQIFRCLPKPIRSSLLEMSVNRAFDYHKKIHAQARLVQDNALKA